jgi:hypothetical protein
MTRPCNIDRWRADRLTKWKKGQTMTKTPHVPATITFTDPPIPMRAKLAAAWTSFMFLYIYVDYFAVYKPGFIDDLRAGVVFEFNVSPVLMTAFLALVTVPILMVMLSVILPARSNRTTNLIVASLYIPVTIFNAVGESLSWTVFYGLSIVIEMLLLVFILRSAWTWPRAQSNAAGDTMVDSLQQQAHV